MANARSNSDSHTPSSNSIALELTTDPADDDAPTVSPDGKEFAFHSWRTGNRDIFVQRLDGGGVTQLTHSPKQEALAEWGPDGRTIAFGMVATENGYGFVHRDASGKWGEPVYRDVRANRPVWAPDGKRVVLMTSATGGGIMVAAADSGVPRTLVDIQAVGEQKIDFAQWPADNVIYADCADSADQTDSVDRSAFAVAGHPQNPLNQQDPCFDAIARE